MNIRQFSIDLPLLKEFRISRGSASIKRNYFVSIDNICFGEGSGSIFYGPPEDDIIDDLNKGIELLKISREITENSLQQINDMAINSISKTALIQVILHLISRKTGKYPWDILELDEPADIRTSFTVGVDSPAQVIADIEDSTYPIIKLKLGTEHDEMVIDHVKEIRDKTFRIDANAAWQPEEAQKMVYFLSKCNVELIEQPTSPEAISEWPYIKGTYKIPFIMDEGMNTVEDYYKYAEYIDGVNIKMSKSGGILNAQKLAVQARKNKRLVMIGCMVETSIGISQAIYLSSLADYFDLDGPLLLKEDISSDIKYEGERISVDETIIGGPTIKREFLNG